jgi:branched-chain amino acid aminotransferase
MVPSPAVPVAVNIDGVIHGQDDARISVFDHGFLFGEGVYEVLRTYDRRPFLFAEHMRRLTDEALLARIDDTVTAAALEGEAYIRILLTRGEGDIVYDPSACPSPSIVIIAKAHREAPAEAMANGVNLSIVSVVRNHPGSVDPAIKSNNLLNNALAMQQAIGAGADEALMCNQAGEIVECSQSNFFVVRDGAVITPPLDAVLLPGITRAFVLDLARELGVDAREETIAPGYLSRVQEAFITGTTREVTPVVRVDQQSIGDGTPGPITRRLLDAFRERAALLTR